jgi:hypothetical protein
LGVAEDGREKRPLADELQDAEAKRESVDMCEKQWYDSVDLCTFDQGNCVTCSDAINLLTLPFLRFISWIAVQRKIKNLGLKSADVLYDTYLKESSGKGNLEARYVAKNILGEDVWWSWDCTSSKHLTIRVSCVEYAFQFQGQEKAIIITLVA